VRRRDPSVRSAGAAGPCRFCGGRSEFALEAFDRNRELSDERFRYSRCLDCGTVSLVDVPSDLARYYAGTERYYGRPAAGELDRLADAEAHKLAFVGGPANAGRLVEIGPGSGVFSYAAQRAGFEVTGIDIDAETCEHLRAVVGVPAIQSGDPAAALAALPPSRAVAMWHVLEHLADPAATLEEVAANPEPGGVLALSAPNPRSLQFRLLGARWAHLDAPRHLALMPLDAVVARARGVGLRVVDVTTTDPTGRDCTYLGWEYAMRRRPAVGTSPRPLLLTTFALAAALRPLEGSGQRGAAYTAVFVKDG
jgi:SAM-dependent methyltransferase